MALSLIPFIFAIIIGITIFIIERDKNTSPFGYVDLSGILNESQLSEYKIDEEEVELIAFPDKGSALKALERGEIQAFHVVPDNFLNSRKVDLYYWDEYPNSSILNQFDDFVRANVLPEGPNALQNRIIYGINLTLVSEDGNRQFDEESRIYYNSLSPGSSYVFHFLCDGCLRLFSTGNHR